MFLWSNIKGLSLSFNRKSHGWFALMGLLILSMLFEDLALDFYMTLGFVLFVLFVLVLSGNLLVLTAGRRN